MTTASAQASTAKTLEVPGAHLYYELRGRGPLMVLVGAPMDARAFGPLAELLATDHTVLTTDPRGINRSTVDDPDQDSTPALRADDLSRLVTHLDAGPATVLGSSGGAVTALALAQAHPDQVSTVVAHEPPLSELLADRGQLSAVTESMIASYRSGDIRSAWALFMASANIHIPDEIFEGAFVAKPDAQAAADDRYQFLNMLRGTATWQPDLAALRTAEPPIVVGLGEESAGQLCDRTSRALATALGTVPTMFPGGHIGFVEQPPAFATRLRSLLGEG